MDQKKWTDEALLKALRSEDPIMYNAAFEHLYKDESLRATIRKILMEKYGDAIDLKDVFAMALEKLHLKIHEFDPQKSALNTAIVNFAQQEAHTSRRGRIREQKREAHFAQRQGQADDPIRRDSDDILRETLSYLNKRCQTLLQLFTSGFSMKQIAAKMGYSDENSAKMAKSDCLKKLKAFFKENPNKRPDFLYDGI